MKRKLKGARTLLTGASSGIGRALAKQAAKAGAQLVLNARRTELLRSLKAEILTEIPNAQIELVSGDITLAETRAELLERANSVFGGVDILINNAGAAATGRFEGNSPERLKRVMDLNFNAPVELIRMVIPQMKTWRENQNEKTVPIPPMIVNLSSIVGLRGVTHYSEYCAAKAAIRAFSQSIRTELHRYGISVLIVCPGSTDTGFFTDYMENTGEPSWPNHSRVTPEYVASRILRAIEKDKMEILPFFLGKVMFHLDHFCPRFLENAMVRYEEREKN
ncbi:MAG: SDR family NAD(P)-dependent oxidoreductase [Planctomycetaceae bacterium]|nr:SDR family NAD(P)-dependent oxidoreductase [Planctomycetaceae bacterium]